MPKLKLFKEKTGIDKRKCTVYMLTNFNTSKRSCGVPQSSLPVLKCTLSMFPPFLAIASIIFTKLKLFKEKTGIDKRKCTVYMLTNFNSTLQEDLHRVYTIVFPKLPQICHFPAASSFFLCHYAEITITRATSC